MLCEHNPSSYTSNTLKVSPWKTQLIDPANYKPFYPYNGRIVDGDDVDDLKDLQKFLRIMCDNIEGEN